MDSTEMHTNVDPSTGEIFPESRPVGSFSSESAASSPHFSSDQANCHPLDQVIEKLDQVIQRSEPAEEIPFVRAAYPANYNTDKASIASGIEFTDPSLAQQQFRDEADINTIVRRFGLTGELPEQGAYPAYGDFETVTDYHTAQNIVRAAGEAFMALPGHVRARFGHDPQALMLFCADPANHDEARKLGLTRTLTEPFTPKVPDPKPQAGVPADPIASPPAGKPAST